MKKIKGQTKVRIPSLVPGCLILVTAALIQLSAPAKGFAWDPFGCTWCTSEFNECSNDASIEYAWGITACDCGDCADPEAEDRAVECREQVALEYAVAMQRCNDDFSDCWSGCEY
jgi:hypothetical protein